MRSCEIARRATSMGTLVLLASTSSCVFPGSSAYTRLVSASPAPMNVSSTEPSRKTRIEDGEADAGTENFNSPQFTVPCAGSKRSFHTGVPRVRKRTVVGSLALRINSQPRAGKFHCQTPFFCVAGIILAPRRISTSTAGVIVRRPCASTPRTRGSDMTPDQPAASNSACGRVS